MMITIINYCYVCDPEMKMTVMIYDCNTKYYCYWRRSGRYIYSVGKFNYKMYNYWNVQKIADLYNNVMIITIVIGHPNAALKYGDTFMTSENTHARHREIN